LLQLQLFLQLASPPKPETVRIGIYDNMPDALPDKSGKTEGVLIDLLEEMAKKEGWNLVDVPCEWADCLRALENDESN